MQEPESNPQISPRLKLRTRVFVVICMAMLLIPVTVALKACPHGTPPTPPTFAPERSLPRSNRTTPVTPEGMPTDSPAPAATAEDGG